MLEFAALVAVALLWLIALYQLAGWMWRSIVLRRAACRILPRGPVSTQQPTQLVEVPDGGPVKALYVEPIRTVVLPSYTGPCGTCGASSGRGCWELCPDRPWRG